MGEQIYYHFLSSDNAINDLENEWIKVSTLDELNDPFELEPYLRYDFKERQPYHKVRRRISKKWGLLCFSNDWNEPTLWSYYADKHKGVAIGFKILKDKILKVGYTSMPKRQKIILTDNDNIDENLYLNLAKIKYKKWKHENEHRILIELKDCITENCSNLENNKLYFIKFEDRLKVRKIILGSKFRHRKEKDNIIRLATKLDAEVIAARMEWQGYRIQQCGRWTPIYRNLMVPKNHLGD